MKLPGVVTNVTNFGAFVDVGVHNDGLVHISQLGDHFVKDPRQVVKVHQTVTVTVIGLDLGRGRVSLSMKKDPFAEGARSPKNGDANGPRRETKGYDKNRQAGKGVFNNAFSRAFAKLKDN
jgi:uncharacterized protein